VRSVVISGDPPFNMDRVFEGTFFVLLLSAAVIGRPAYQKFIAVLNLTLFVAMVVLTSLTPG
jgi:hypothetical protein